MFQRIQLTPRRLALAAARWPVASQQQARRNALVASTHLTRRRLEQHDVDDFLAELAAGRPPADNAPTVPRQVGHTA